MRGYHPCASALQPAAWHTCVSRASAPVTFEAASRPQSVAICVNLQQRWRSSLFRSLT